MTDDEVDRALAHLERQLDALQRELHAAPTAPPAPDAPAGQDARASAPAAAPPPGAGPRLGAVPTDPGLPLDASGRPAPDDPLEQFGVELRRLAHELVAAYDRVLAHERRTRPSRRTLVVETEAELRELAALERALAASPAIRAVRLRAYADGRASLAVELAPGETPRDPAS
jgi:hypothetical protein